MGLSTGVLHAGMVLSSLDRSDGFPSARSHPDPDLRWIWLRSEMNLQ